MLIVDQEATANSILGPNVVDSISNPLHSRTFHAITLDCEIVLLAASHREGSIGRWSSIQANSAIDLALSMLRSPTIDLQAILFPRVRV
jgi:hypothetical protein